jgi:O-antigen ligase
MLLSGARGSWLACVVGLAVLLIMSPIAQRPRAVRAMALLVTVAGTALYFSGLAELVVERVFGVAAHPLSLGQRVGVLGATLSLWSRSPVVGFGFGQYLDQVTSIGFVFSNTENEYVNFLLASGIVGFGLFLFVLGRTGVNLVRSRRQAGIAPIAALFAGWVVLIGTFNVFSWSAGLAYFMLIVALCRLSCLGHADES